MKIWRLATFVAVAVLVACGGGGGGGMTVTPAGPITAPATAGPSVPVSFKIKVSGTGASSTARKPAFVSPNTQSVTVAVAIAAGLPTTIATVNLTGSNCTTDASGTTCTISAGAPSGSDTFTITCWSGLNGGGNQLSTATIPNQTVAINASNVLSFTLNGVAATASVILGSTSVLVGTPATIAVTVVALDASGAIIIGPGNYSSPITLADSDTSGTTTLSATTVNAPGTNVNLTYTGGSLAAAIITPSIGSVAGTAQTFAPTGTAYAVYALPNFPSDGTDVIGAGPDGNTWFATYGGIGFITNGGASTLYTTNVPIADIYGVANAAGALWFGDWQGDLGSITPGGVVTLVTAVATPDGCGNGPSAKSVAHRVAQGQRRISVSVVQTTCGGINWMVTGPDGNVWFSDDFGLIGSIVPGSNTATEWPITQFVGSNAEPVEIAFGSDGALYAADETGFIDRVTVSGGAVQNVTQVPVTIANCFPFSLAVASDGNAWVGDECANLYAIPTGAAFSSANLQNWSISTITGGFSAGLLVNTPGGLWMSTFGFGNGTSAPQVFRLVNAGTAAAPSPVIGSVSPFGASAEVQNVGVASNGNVWAANNCPVPNTIAKILYGAPQTGSLSVVRSKASARSHPLGTRRSAQVNPCGGLPSSPPSVQAP